jgi:hypothetical protein
MSFTNLTLTSKRRIAQILKNKILIVTGEFRNPSSSKTKACIYLMHKFDPHNIDITLRSESKYLYRTSVAQSNPHDNTTTFKRKKEAK